MRLAPDGEGRNLSASSYDDATQTLTDLIIFERNSEGQLLATTTASATTWSAGSWILQDGVRQNEQLVVDAPRTPVREPVERLETPLDPQRIKVYQLQDLANNLSFAQLSDMHGTGGLSAEQAQRIDRIRWGRLGALASTFIALAAALPCFLVRIPKPMMGPTLRAAPVAFAGLGAAAAASSLILPGLPMWLCALLPPLILVPLALALFTSVRS